MCVFGIRTSAVLKVYRCRVGKQCIQDLVPLQPNSENRTLSYCGTQFLGMITPKLLEIAYTAITEHTFHYNVTYNYKFPTLAAYAGLE